MGTIGGIAVAVSLVISVIDARVIFRSKLMPKSFLYEAIKEFASTMAALFWLLGNTWWAYGEVWDLVRRSTWNLHFQRTTAGYNDLYKQYSDQAAYVLYASGVIGNDDSWMEKIAQVSFFGPFTP